MMSGDRKTYTFETVPFAAPKMACFINITLFVLFAPPLTASFFMHPEYRIHVLTLLLGMIAFALVNAVLLRGHLRGLKVTFDGDGIATETLRQRAFLSWEGVSYYRIANRWSPHPVVKLFTGQSEVGMVLPQYVNCEGVVSALEEGGIPLRGGMPLAAERIGHWSRLFGYASLGLLLVAYCNVLADTLFGNAMSHIPSQAAISLTALLLLLAMYAAGLAIVTGMASLNTFRVGWLSEENPKNGIAAGLAGFLGAPIVWIHLMALCDRIMN